MNTNMLSKNLGRADEVRTFDKGKIEVVQVDGHSVGRATFQPGWRWTECMRGVAGTQLCEVDHFGVVVSGRMAIRMKDGSQIEAGPGDVVEIAPGHDAWVVGNEPCVWLELKAAQTYAKKS